MTINSNKAEFVKETFHELAPQYNNFNAYSSFGQYRLWVKRMVSHLCPLPHSRMLDIAAGTGDISLCAAQTYTECFDEIVVSDFCKDMLDVAEKRYKNGESHGVPCTFKIEDAHQLSYEDNSFDVVTIAYGIRNFVDRSQALREAYRVLKPGGQMVVLEFALPPNPAWRALYHLYLKTMIPFIGGILIKNKSGFNYFRQSILSFPPQSVIVEELKAAQFRNVEFENLSGGIVAVYTAAK